MHEYALLAENGTVINIVVTHRPIAELQHGFPNFTVKPTCEVSQVALHRYHYWGARSGYGD